MVECRCRIKADTRNEMTEALEVSESMHHFDV